MVRTTALGSERRRNLATPPLLYGGRVPVKRQKLPTGFHEVVLCEATSRDEDGKSTKQLAELPYAGFADSDPSVLLGDNTRPVLDDNNRLTLAPEATSRFSCNLRDHGRLAADDGNDAELQLDTDLQIRLWELESAKARRARLNEVYDLKPEQLKNRGIATVEMIIRRGNWKQDPLKMVEAEIINLNDEIRGLEQQLRDTLNEAAQLNAQAHAMAPKVVAPLEARHGERPSMRRHKPGTQN